MNTKLTGDISVAITIQALLKLGKSVSLPFGDRNRYDLIVDSAGVLSKVQVKTGWESNGCIKFNTSSTTTVNGKLTAVAYQGQVDAFIVYYPPEDSLYYVPIKDCTSSSMLLRLSQPKNKQAKNVRYAKEFLLA